MRHNTSAPVNCQTASRQATTTTKMHRLVIQKDSPRTSNFRHDELLIVGKLDAKAEAFIDDLLLEVAPTA